MTEAGDIQNPEQPNSLAMMPQSNIEKFWTEPRREIYSWFQRNAPSLGELYLGSLRIIYIPLFPGRVRFVSHAVREIRNRLPEVISGFRSNPTVQYKNKLDEISKIWKRNGLPIDGSLPQTIAKSEESLSDSIPLPKILYGRISRLVKDHDEARQKPIDAAKRLFSGTTQEDLDLGNNLRPVVDQWLSITKWFVKNAHDSGTVDNDVDQQEFRKNFEIFETTLGALLKGFFATIEDLDEILEDTNS